MSGTVSPEEPGLQAASGFHFDSWEELSNRLTDDVAPSSGKNPFRDHRRPLLWGVPQGDALPSMLMEAARWQDGSRVCKSKAEELICWLNEQLEARPSVQSTLAATGLASVLRPLAGTATQPQWMELLDLLETFFQSGLQHDDRLVNQAANELGLALAATVPELNLSVDSGQKAFHNWRHDLEDLLDADGAILAEYCSGIPTFLAIWTRCHRWASMSGQELPESAQHRWEWFLRYSMRLLRKDGTTMLADPAIPFQIDLYQAAVKTSTDKDDRAIARLILPGGNPKKKKIEMFAEEGTFSEWAGLGVMQQDWSPVSPRLAIAIQDQSIRIEVCRSKPLFELNGLPDISINGKALMAVGEWEEVCSHFDDDINYLELEIPLEDEVRLQRQIMLVPDDEVVLIADAVFCAAGQERIDYQGHIRFSQGVSGLQETENNEVYLQRRKIVALAIPVGLEEWQQASENGRVRVESGQMVLAQSSYSRTLYAPLFFHLNPSNSTKPRTWRKLHVAESLDVVEDDTARAHRVRVGDQQWVFYKTFGESANRTFLGQNHTSDFFLGRFLEDGNVEELISLEP